VGNLFIPFLAPRDFGYADAPFPFMLGMMRDKQQSAKIKDGTYIIDLDKNGIWQQPHTSVILSTSGTTKDISIDDLPDLPYSLQKKLTQDLHEIQKKAEKRADRLLTEKEVHQVRCHFFEFFCQMLKYFPFGIEGSEWTKQRRTNPQYYDTEPGKLFNYDEFLKRYYNGNLNDPESWSFLRYFTSMPLFKRLVERYVLEKDYADLSVFQARINEAGRRLPDRFRDED